MTEFTVWHNVKEKAPEAWCNYLIKYKNRHEEVKIGTGYTDNNFWRILTESDEEDYQYVKINDNQWWAETPEGPKIL